MPYEELTSDEVNRLRGIVRNQKLVIDNQAIAMVHWQRAVNILWMEKQELIKLLREAIADCEPAFSAVVTDILAAM